MNIDVVGRIRPPVRGEGGVSLDIDSHHRLASRPGGTYFSFQTLHRPEASNYDVFKKSAEPLLDLWLAGFNVCLLVTGESGSGKSYTVAGESMSKSGIIPILLDHVFTKIGEDDRYMYDSRLSEKTKVTLQVYEIYNELIKDLMQVPGVRSQYLDVQEVTDLGPQVKGGTVTTIGNSADGTSLFRQAWARRTSSYTDYGPAKNYTSMLVYLDIVLRSGENPLPNKSRFTIVVTPGAEKLTDDSTQIRLREGPTLNKSLIALTQLVSALANQPYPDRVISYSESKLTQLLKEEIGGNSKTRVLICVKPQSEGTVLSPVLRVATQFSQVKNFPILNDAFAQQLLTQYRSRIINLQRQLGLGSGLADPGNLPDVQDELRRVQTENLQLRDKNERMHQKLEELQNKFGSLAHTKTDLSAQLLMTEEEKLKVSKTLVDMQIENNRIKEEAEAGKFELTNRVLQLENELMEMEIERDKQTKAAKNSKDRLAEVEKDRKDLADEYVVLKTNYLTLTKAHEKEAAKNEELGVELLNLVNAKAALMRQLENMEAGEQDDPGYEVDRVRAIVSRLSMRKPEELVGSQKDREDVEKTLFANERRFQNEMERLRMQHDDDQRKIESNLTRLQKEIHEARNIARERQKRVAELNAELITVRQARSQLQQENNRMQHKLKDIGEDFRSRLVKYVKDISQHIDSGGGKPDQTKVDAMRKYVDNMIQDLKKAHKVREEQLSQAAQNYRHRTNQVVRKHEELLVAYRELREQCEARGLDDLDLGPNEHKLQMTDHELQSAQQKQINRLREDLGQAQNELEGLKIRMRMNGDLPADSMNRPQLDGENWSELRKQLREFTLNTQQELEQERAQLLTKNAILEEECKELHSYINSHLARYKKEIARLRQLLGMEDGEGFNSPSPFPDRARKNRTGP